MSEANPGAARSLLPEARLSIGALSRATGIPVETLRTWERRYHFPVPIRKPSGHRLYPLSAVRHLQRVAQAIAGGHRVAEVVRLSLPTLESMLSRAPSPFQAPYARVGPASDIEGLMDAVRRIDSFTLRSAFRSRWSQHGPLGFLENVAAPLMTEVGFAWADGRLEIRHEHFATAQLGDFLREVRAPFDAVASGPEIALTTLPGDQHEVGLLMAALAFSMRGWRVYHLGVETPAGELEAMLKDVRLSAVGISVSSVVEPRGAERAVRELRKLLPEDVRLFLGGSGAPLTVPGTGVFQDLKRLHEALGATA